MSLNGVGWVVRVGMVLFSWVWVGVMRVWVVLVMLLWAVVMLVSVMWDWMVRFGVVKVS